MNRRGKLLSKAELNTWLGGLIRRGAIGPPRQKARAVAAAEVLGAAMGWLHGSTVDLTDSTLYSQNLIEELLKKLERDME